MCVCVCDLFRSIPSHSTLLICVAEQFVVVNNNKIITQSLSTKPTCLAVEKGRGLTRDGSADLFITGRGSKPTAMDIMVLPTPLPLPTSLHL